MFLFAVIELPFAALHTSLSKSHSISKTNLKELFLVSILLLLQCELDQATLSA